MKKFVLLLMICVLGIHVFAGDIDVDDILLRLFGAWISYAVYSSFRRKTFK